MALLQYMKCCIDYLFFSSHFRGKRVMSNHISLFSMPVHINKINLIRDEVRYGMALL